MSCYNKMLAADFGSRSETGKPIYKILGKYSDYRNNPKYDFTDIDTVVIPCGNCIGCRLDKSREWADRMLLELDHTKKAVFITLTYRPEDIKDCISMIDEDGTEHYTLVKEHFQQFMKILRSRKQFEDKEIRFYACGEYGSRNKRCHFHAILFGVNLNDFMPVYVCGNNEFGDLYYRSPVLESIWTKGISSLSEVSWQTCAYVARYVTKKLNGPSAIAYAEENKCPEFALMSRRPGIGAFYLTDHDFDFDYSKISLADQKEGKTISVPKYFLKKLEKIDPIKYNEIKAQRKKFAEDREYLKIMNTDLDIDGIDTIEAERKEKSANTLHRRIEESLY